VVAGAGTLSLDLGNCSMKNDTALSGRRRLATAIAVICTTWAMAPARLLAADVSGRVADMTGSIGFEGAVVRIPELGRSQITGRDGRFRFAGLPDGRYTVAIDYLGAQSTTQAIDVAGGDVALGDIAIGDDDADILDNVLVVGQIAGQAAAINQQRNADNLKVIVASDAIGQFPDQNAAEALQRLPGLSIARDQGEGRFVVIRGLDPALNTTTINGVRVPGPEDDSRQVNLDVIASESLETLEVTKTVTPDMDGDSVGGHIEIKSLSAYDRAEGSFTGRIEGSYNELREATSPKVGVTYTDLIGADDIAGVAVSFSGFKREFGSEGIETATFDRLDTPDGSEQLAIAEGEQRDYTITRERLSASVNVDVRPSETSEFYWRNLFSRFSDDEVQLTNTFIFEDGDTAALDASGGLFEGATLRKLTEGRSQTQDILSTVLGGINYVDLWTIDYSAAYSYADTEETDSFGAAWQQEGIDLVYDLRDSRRPDYFAVDGGAFADAAAYALDEVVEEPYDTREDETAFAVNVRRDLELGSANAFVKVGAKARLRGKDADFDSTVYEGFGGDFTLADFDRADIDYAFGPFFPIAGAGGLRDFIRANRASFEIDEDETAIERQGGDYAIDEDIYAAYAMASADFGSLRLIGGLRVERTEFDAIGTQLRIDEEDGDGDPAFSPVAAAKTYTDWLPGLHLRWEPVDSLVMRASATRSIARPNFAESAPFQVIEIEEDDGEFERSAELGNPDLDPLSSTNLDVSVEYYPGDVAVVSAGVFYKDITDFIVLADVSGEGVFADFDEAIQPLNGGDASVRGLELGWTQRLAFLPGALDGFLVSANHAWIDSESELPFRATTVPLPRQSDRVGNVSVGWEKYGVSIRLAGTYRSAYLDEIGELDDPDFDRYADDNFQLDLAAKYRLSENVQVYFNAVNLNDEPFYAYFGNRRYNSQFEQYGRTYELGFQANF
jgi:TonB-dependent receptor